MGAARSLGPMNSPSTPPVMSGTAAPGTVPPRWLPDCPVRARIEQSLDQHHVRPCRAHDRADLAPLQRAQLGDDIGHLARRMFGVDQDPVEPTGGEEFGQRRAVQRGEQSELLTAEPILEHISRGCHHASMSRSSSPGPTRPGGIPDPQSGRHGDLWVRPVRDSQQEIDQRPTGILHLSDHRGQRRAVGIRAEDVVVDGDHGPHPLPSPTSAARRTHFRRAPTIG